MLSEPKRRREELPYTGLGDFTAYAVEDTKLSVGDQS